MTTRDRLVEAAITATGLDDFGSDSWQEGLDVLLTSLDATADLNEIGVGVAEGGVVTDLSNRLRIEGWRRDHPEVATQRVDRPIIIVGQPRTGTTILFDLMAQDRTNRAPLSWEIERPVPAPRTATYGTDPRIAEAQAGFDLVESIIPGFTSFHELGAQLAQEDVRIFTSDFRSMQFSLQFEVPEYNRWLLHEADMAPAYRWHRRFLQHLQSEHHSERWLLKSPAHLWSLPALLAEYPDAIVIQNHRDPLKVIASISALGASLREMTTDNFDVRTLAAQYGDDIMVGLDRALQARADRLFARARSWMCATRTSATTRSRRLPTSTTRSAWSSRSIPRRGCDRSLPRIPATRPAASSATRSPTPASTRTSCASHARPYQEFFGVETEQLS
ncbi:MAG: sulfotransferase [Microthrixaceae bacterium]